MDTSEQWLPVVGYEGLYEVSSFGRIKSLARVVDRINHGRPCTLKINEKIIKPFHLRPKRFNHRYLAFGVSLNGVKKSLMVHIVVAESFIGSRPDGLVVDHIDCDIFNNSKDNLRYITKRENVTRGESCLCRENKSSPFVGVTVIYYKDSRYYRAGLSISGKRINLGCFKTEIEASEAYQRAIANV